MDKMNIESKRGEGVSRRSVMRGVLITIMGIAGLLTRKVTADPASRARPAASPRRRQEPQYVFDEYGRVIQVTYPCSEVKVTTYEYRFDASGSVVSSRKQESVVSGQGSVVRSQESGVSGQESAGKKVISHQ